MPTSSTATRTGSTNGADDTTRTSSRIGAPSCSAAQNLISHLGVYRTAAVRRVGGFREGLEGSQDYDLALRVIEQSEPRQDPSHPVRPVSLACDPWVGGAEHRREGVRARCGTPCRAGASRSHQPGSHLRAGPRPGLSPADPLCAARPAAARHDHHSDAGSRGRAVAMRERRDVALDLRELRHRDRRQRQHRGGDARLLRSAASRIRVSRSCVSTSRSTSRGSTTWPPPRARGSVLCFLNNDTDVISPGWLEEMVSLCQPRRRRRRWRDALLPERQRAACGCDSWSGRRGCACAHRADRGDCRRPRSSGRSRRPCPR